MIDYSFFLVVVLSFSVGNLLILFLVHVLQLPHCVGIMFQDITTLLLDPKAFKDTIDLFVERYKGKNISVVAGKKKLRGYIYIF